MFKLKTITRLIPNIFAQLQVERGANKINRILSQACASFKTKYALPDLAGEGGVVVLLGGGELDLGDGGDAPRVLHLPRRLLDPLAQHAALAVQPRDLMEEK